MALSNQEKRWIADELYRDIELSENESLQGVDYSTMPGQFTEEEKLRRMQEAYHSAGGSTIEEVEEMLLAL